MSSAFKVFIVVGCTVFLSLAFVLMVFGMRAAAVQDCVATLERNGGRISRSRAANAQGVQEEVVVGVDLSDPDAPTWEPRREGWSSQRRPGMDALVAQPLTAATIARVLAFPELRSLDLKGRTVAPECWPIFAKVQSPYHLSVSAQRFDAAVLDQLGVAPNLNRLWIFCEKLDSPAALEAFRARNGGCNVMLKQIPRARMEHAFRYKEEKK